ncbi:MAG: ATP synthase F1 subunit epsilon [Planctomycetes bacterium]|nr:ATP synthase F1 subunit epsilon [Planctomycetota bacterium]
MKSFEIEIITPEKMVFKGSAQSLIVPAHKGYLGVLVGHAPFIAALNAGKVTVRPDGQKDEHVFTITGGMMETTPTKTTILADSVE